MTYTLNIGMEWMKYQHGMEWMKNQHWIGMDEKSTWNGIKQQQVNLYWRSNIAPMCKQ